MPGWRVEHLVQEAAMCYVDCGVGECSCPEGGEVVAWTT